MNEKQANSPPYLRDARLFSGLLPAQGRLLALDTGEKTIGLAFSDSSRLIATPHSIIERGKFSRDAQRLTALITSERVAGLVLGYPVNMDGSEGPRCQSVRQFARNLARHCPLPMLLADERLSTSAVTRMMIEADLSRERRKELVDKLAAAYILQGVLDEMRRE